MGVGEGTEQGDCIKPKQNDPEPKTFTAKAQRRKGRQDKRENL